MQKQPSTLCRGPHFVQQWRKLDLVVPRHRHVFLHLRQQTGKGTQLGKEKETLGETYRVVGIILLEEIGEGLQHQLLAFLHLLGARQRAAI